MLALCSEYQRRDSRRIAVKDEQDCSGPLASGSNSGYSGEAATSPLSLPHSIPSPAETPRAERARRIYQELRALLRDSLIERLGPQALNGALKMNLSFSIHPLPDPENSVEDSQVQAFTEKLLGRIHRIIDEEVSRNAPFPPGRVRCYWCGSFDCSHAPPASPRSVFAGYSPTGLPIWQELATVALEQRDPRIEDLYRDPPVPLAILQSGRDLVNDQLPVYGKRSMIYRILGQVVVGYLSIQARPQTDRTAVALTLQAVEINRGRERVHLNVIGQLPDGTDLWQILEEESDSRLADALGAARRRLTEIGIGRRKARSARDRQAISALARLARNLDRIFRQRTRRTKHSQDRHLNRERPAAAALRDANKARPEEIYRDVVASTWVVVGPRSRVHIFNDAGQHITSVMYPGESVRRRTARGKWRAATPEQVRTFREALDGTAQKGE